MRQRAIGISVGAACIILLVITAPRLPPQPNTYSEAVNQVLVARHIPYRGIEGSVACGRDIGSCIAQNNSIRFELMHIGTATLPIVAGRVDCSYYRADCAFSAPEIGLVNVPLRDLVWVQSRPSRLDDITEYLKAQWRAWSQRVWAQVYEAEQ